MAGIINDTEKPNSITMEVYYPDDADEDVKEFYYDKRNETNIVATVILNPAEISTNYIYTLVWDGRDDIDNRVLLEGRYVLRVKADFGGIAKKLAGVPEKSTGIKIKAPELYNMACSYPGTNQSVIEGFAQSWMDSIFRFDEINVPYLEEVEVDPPDEDDSLPGYYAEKFEWLRQFDIVGNKISLTGYEKDNDDDGIGFETEMQDLNDRYAVVSYLGHAGRHSGSPYCGFLMFPDSKYLHSECGSSYEGGCETGLCLDKKCDGTNRDVKCKPEEEASPDLKWMDEVLIAVLAGCNSATEATDLPPSVAKAMVDHGTDCAIGTLEYFYLPLQVFWYYRFYEIAEREKTSTAFDCARLAYNAALKDLVYVSPGLDNNLKPEVKEDFETIKKYFYDLDTINRILIYPFAELFVIRGDESVTMFPARYGNLTKCPKD